MTSDFDRRLGVMYGLAYGDALGRPTEFLKADSLRKFGSPFQVRVGINTPRQGIVTDDTQMSLYIARASLGTAQPKDLTARLTKELTAWGTDPRCHDGRRAPGATCTGAVADLKKGKTWIFATREHSKGNGANMRVAPMALRTDWTWEELAGASQLQAAMTHGHPTALAAAHLTAVTVRILLTGFCSPGEDLIDMLLAYCNDQKHNYWDTYLGGLWKLWKPKGVASPEEFAERGWTKMMDALLAIYKMPRNVRQDPCDVAGDGWVAEEALACALHTLLCFPDDPTNAVRRAAFTDGDSDSIASITGALAGAAYGRKAFPANWIENIEYRRTLDSLTAKLTRATAV
jgi:ADP-ribosylglycohydrolase